MTDTLPQQNSQSSPEQEQPKTASAPTSAPAPAAPVKATVIVTKPSPASPAAGIAAAVNKASASKVPVPPGLKFFNTDDLGQEYFHGILYGDTDARKTTTAAEFGKKEETLIVLCRQKEQVIPLRGQGRNVLWVNNAAELRYVLMYPEQAADHFGFTTWRNEKDRVLIVDDLTEGITLLLEDQVNERTGEEYKDQRKVYGEAGKELREMILSLRRKPMHLILIALAKVTDNPLTNEERISPSLPPSMSGLVTTDTEYTFYLKKSNWKMVTKTQAFQYKDTDDKGKERIYSREIFAKRKLPKLLEGKNPPVLMIEEDMNLRSVWERIKSGKSAQGK